MIGVVATLTIQEGKAQDFETHFTALAAKVRELESGNHLYQLTKSRTEPNVYKVLELYADQDALTHHGKTDYFRAAGAAFGGLLAAAPHIEYLDTVG